MQDLNDLHYFAQVVRHGGFSALRATGEPKSKLSEAVAQLERNLGVRLIERGGGGEGGSQNGRRRLWLCREWFGTCRRAS